MFRWRLMHSSARLSRERKQHIQESWKRFNESFFCWVFSVWDDLMKHCALYRISSFETNFVPNSLLFHCSYSSYLLSLCFKFIFEQGTAFVELPSAYKNPHAHPLEMKIVSFVWKSSNSLDFRCSRLYSNNNNNNNNNNNRLYVERRRLCERKKKERERKKENFFFSVCSNLQSVWNM